MTLTRKQYLAISMRMLPNCMWELCYQFYCLGNMINNGIQATFNDIRDNISDVEDKVADVNQTLIDIKDKMP